MYFCAKIIKQFNLHVDPINKNLIVYNSNWQITLQIDFHFSHSHWPLPAHVCIKVRTKEHKKQFNSNACPTWNFYNGIFIHNNNYLYCHIFDHKIYLKYNTFSGKYSISVWKIFCMRWSWHFAHLSQLTHFDLTNFLVLIYYQTLYTYYQH